MYYLFMLQFVLALLALFLLWQSWRYFRQMRLWKRITSTPFPAEYEKIVSKVPHYRMLPEAMRRKLQEKIRFFIATKEFKGIGIEVTDEMRLIIAFYACLLQLRRDDCYDRLMTILIYPSEVIAKRIEAEGGVYREGQFLLEGESAGGTVVIAWSEARREAYHPRGHNVIVHELAHELDAEDGATDGVPPLPYGRYDGWTKVLFSNYTKLKDAFRRGRYLEKYKLIGPYAATNEAEFFAVVSELFFERPRMLKRHFPDLYRELESFYEIDTVALFGEIG